MKHQKEQTVHRIAYTIDYRGDNDDRITFLLRGVPTRIVDSVFLWLSRGGYLFSGVKINTEFDVLRRNGYSTNRIAVTIDHLNTSMISVDDIAHLMEARLKAEIRCIVQPMSMQRFLNV